MPLKPLRHIYAIARRRTLKRSAASKEYAFCGAEAPQSVKQGKHKRHVSSYIGVWAPFERNLQDLGPPPTTSTVMLPQYLPILAIIAGSALANWQNAPGLARDTAPPGASPYTFDLNAGAALQTETDDKPATDVEFTTGGGVTHSQPYDYQRIGSDGESKKHRTCRHLIMLFRSSALARCSYGRDPCPFRPRANPRTVCRDFIFHLSLLLTKIQYCPC